MSGPLIYTVDIETSPAICLSFQTRNTNITPVQVIQPTEMICFAGKFRGESRVHFSSEYHHGKPKMLEVLHRHLDLADAVVTYNGDNFDLQHILREFHLAGLSDPSPFISVDLYKVIKKREKWMSHKLAYITDQLKLSGKMDNSGWRLWRTIAAPENDFELDRAWREMRRYNKQDVVTTEELLEEYLPYVKNLPAFGLYSDELDPELVLCPVPTCGSEDVQKRGYRRTKTRRYQQYQCQECGKWFSDTRSEGGVRQA